MSSAPPGPSGSGLGTSKPSTPMHVLQPTSSLSLLPVAPLSLAGASCPTGRETRRSSDPARAQQLWDAIKAVRMQKQIPAITRMSRYMNRFYQIKKDETQRLLNSAVEDNLIKLERKVGTKGTKAGVEENAYRLPTSDMLPRERHDWYCFHCHSGGEVLLCAGCHRVFHENCLRSEAQGAILEFGPDWSCNFCKVVQGLPATFNKRERKDLNHLLGLLSKKLAEKMNPNFMTREVPQPIHKNVFEPGGTSAAAAAAAAAGNQERAEQLQSLALKHQQEEEQRIENFRKSEREETWRASFLLKEQIDMTQIEQKCATNQYRLLEEYKSDVQLIVHNCVIYHGAHSTMANMARSVFRDCVGDLKEIQQCRDCYRYSNENREKYWFCKPCRPFHELVYAKQKGFPYWPAKLVASSREGSEVRFFGGYHQKAAVEKQNIRPITTNIHSLQVKRTSLWNKACEELKRYQDLLSKVQENPEFLEDHYGDPFLSDELKAQLVGDDTSSEENSDDEEDEDEDNVEEEEEVHKNPKLLNRSKREKRDLSDDFVSSSSSSQTESKYVNAGVQTQGKGAKRESAGAAAKLAAPSASPITPPGFISEKDLKEIVEKMHSEFDQEKKRAVNVATRSLERDLERLKADHATEIEEIVDKQKQELSESKKKQWCFHCDAEAIYWCCWNTAYCSIECQQEHWHKEHKKACRRKR